MPRLTSLTSLLILTTILLISTGLSLGLTWAPCYASLCSENLFPTATRIHIGVEAGIIAGMLIALLLRAHIPIIRSISEGDIFVRRIPVFGKRLSIGGLFAICWIIGTIVATIAYWELYTNEYWTARAPSWPDAANLLGVVTDIAHHADMLLGFVLIPVGRNSLVGKAFGVHQTTLLFAHNWLAYLAILDSLAHGIVYFIFLGVYDSVDKHDPRRELFDVNNPSLTVAEIRQKGNWYAINFAAGLVAWLAMAVMVVTSLPWMRRRHYNLFYYCHVAGATLAVVFASIHASTNFYFLLPGLLLWLYDLAWRAFGGRSGLRKTTSAILEDAGNDWYRIALPNSSQDLSIENGSTKENQDFEHPLQSYNIIIPSVSKTQSHALTVARVANAVSGPVFLVQPATGVMGKSPKRQDAEWTWKVGRLATAAGSIAGASSSEDDVMEKPQNTKIWLRLEGPYFPSDRNREYANHIICIVGGTGFTGAHSLALWWLKHRSRLAGSRFSLVWLVRDRRTAGLQEWTDLKTIQAEQAAANMKLMLHVSSEEGRMGIREKLRSLSEESNHKDDMGQVDGENSVWIYSSGPPDLLSCVEDCCLELEKEVQPTPWARPLLRVSHDVAKWEN